jgi:outer membrane protein assembly factor BamB
VLAAAGNGSVIGGPARTTALLPFAAAHHGRVWVLAEDGKLVAIDATARGALTLDVPGALAFAPSVGDDTICAVAADGSVFSYRETGELRFHARVEETPSAPVAMTKTRVYVPGTKGGLHALDARDGALVWRFGAGARITATPAVADGTVYVTTADGRVIAIDV